MVTRFIRSALGFILVGLALVPAAVASSGLGLGFSDTNSFASPIESDNAVNLVHAREAGAAIARFGLTWRNVASTQPPNAASAANPAWSGYDWRATDSAVRGIADAGLTSLAVVTDAPRWAEGSGRPSAEVAPLGTWKPSPVAYGLFATALAKRYSGRYPDPLRPGATLPAVTSWQAWNEPNLANFLNPQWRKSKSGYVADSPSRYRRLLNAFYSGVKKVSSRNYVVTAGTAPFGDLHPGERRIPPAQFWRDVLCVSAKLRRKRCTSRVSFDAIAHHPYPIGPPQRHALNVDDVSVPDLDKITKPLGVALRAGTVRPARAKQLWITEISWDSKPDPEGLSLLRQAKYLEGALYVLWRQGADVVTWYLMRDEQPIPSYAATLQSGIFMRGDTPDVDVAKPSWTAFHFPFTAYRTRGVARLWGMAPAAGTVTIEAQRGGKWVTALQLRASSNRLFTGRLRVESDVTLRARTGTETSLAWRTS